MINDIHTKSGKAVESSTLTMLDLQTTALLQIVSINEAAANDCSF